MAIKNSGKCLPDEEWVEPYVKEDGTDVSGYCRKKTDHETAADRRKFHEDGEDARGSHPKVRKYGKDKRK